MKAKDFLMIEQDTVQVVAAPFDKEMIQNEFMKKAAEFGFSGIMIDDIRMEAQGITLVLSQGNIKSEITFSYGEDVGPFCAVKPVGNGESVNLDLTPMNPPLIDSAIGKQLDVQNLVWLGKEAFEGIMSAAQIKEAPEGEKPADVVPVGSNGSGAQASSFQQAQTPPMELDAKTVPAPTPKASVPPELPGESLESVGQDVIVKCRDCGCEGSELEFAYDKDSAPAFAEPGELTCPRCGGQNISDVNEGKKKEADSKTPDLDAPAQHQITIAKKTLKMPDAILGVMGGMTKEQAKEILKKYNVKETDEELEKRALPGIKLEGLIYRVTFQKGKETGTMDIEAASERDAEAKAKGKLRGDQKLISIGKKPTKEESIVKSNLEDKEGKELTLFRFVIREGKKVKIPIGSIKKIKEKKTFKPGEFWHKDESKKDKTPAWKKKVGKFKDTPYQPEKKMKERIGYNGNDKIDCPVCKGITGKVNPKCPRCKGRGYIEERLVEQQVTKRFFKIMADELKALPETVSKKELVDMLVRVFQSENPRFDAQRFRLAAGG